MKLTLVLISIVMVAVLVGCGSPAGQVTGTGPAEEIRIGAIIHLTANDYANVGSAFREGIDLAVAEQNAKGGIAGRNVIVIYEDSQYDMKKVVAATNKFIDIDGVEATMISTFTEAKAAGPIFQQRQVPMVVLWDSSKDIESIGDYAFGVGARTESAGSKAADYAYDELGLRRIVIINNNAEWSKSVSGFFQERFEELGGVIVAEHSVLEGETDFRTIITKTKSTNHDGIFVPTSTHTDALLRQLRQQSYDKPIIASDQVTQQTIDVASGAADGIYHTVLMLPEGERTTDFRARYAAKYGHDSDELLYVGLGYDGAKSILRAMELGGTSRDGVKNGLYQVKDLEGSFSAISFDEHGQSPRYESVVQVRNGKDVLVLE